jgi:hypothetical protein
MQDAPKVSSITRPRERNEDAGTASSAVDQTRIAKTARLGLRTETRFERVLLHSYRGHHAAIFVIENMAMEHKRSSHDWITKID